MGGPWRRGAEGRKRQEGDTVMSTQMARRSTGRTAAGAHHGWASRDAQRVQGPFRGDATALARASGDASMHRMTLDDPLE